VIRLDCRQGSAEWIEARLGIPTASQYHRIITPKTGKLSSQAEGYAYELLAEELLGHSLDEGASDFMARGTALEQSAIRLYEFQRDVTTERVGFILRDDRLTGCSPDRLVDVDGGLELKCPSAKVHVGYMLGQDADAYKCQVQGGLWLTGRDWWDWLSYNPEMAPVLIRFQRDEPFIARLAAVVDQFISYLDECRLRLVAGGYLSPERMRRDATGVALRLVDDDATPPVSATQRQNGVQSLAARADAFERDLRAARGLANLSKVRAANSGLFDDLDWTMPARAAELQQLAKDLAAKHAMQGGRS
jgi:hypothetical protein